MYTVFKSFDVIDILDLPRMTSMTFLTFFISLYSQNQGFAQGEVDSF